MNLFTKADVEDLLADLTLYCGTIKEITNVYGPHPHNGGMIGGIIQTYMDSFNFTALPGMCTDEAWTILLADPKESLRRGNRSNSGLKFPKIHKNAELAHRYQLANTLYFAYGGHSHVTEASRLPDIEAMLGYDTLPTYGSVLAAILTDYRSFQEKEEDQVRERNSQN